MGRRKICNCSKLIAAIDAYIEKADKDIEDNLKDSGFVEPKKTVKKMTELEEDLTDILEEDTKFIVSTIQDYDGVQDYVAQKWPEVQNREDVVRKLTRTFESTFNDVIPEYVESYIKRTDADLSAIALTHRTQNWVNSWSSQLADLMRLSDNKNIQNILNNALQNGESVQDTANAIADSGIRSPGYRARRVATTELLRAHSVAQQESFMQSPAVEEKMWRHSGWRKYARQNHMNMDGQRVRKDLPFTLFGEEGGIHYPMYPRDAVLPPGESVNCGCIAEPIVNEYVLGMSLEERQKLQQEAIEQLDDEFDKMLDEQNKLLGNSFNVSSTEYAANSAIRNTGKEVFYDNKADYSIKLEGYSDEVNEGLSKAIEDVAMKGSADRCEHMHLVNLSSGNLTYYETNGEPNSVGYNFWKELDKNPNENYAFIHNHNTDSSFSEPDLITLVGTEQIPVMIAVRNDGVIYAVERSGSAIKNTYFDDIYKNDVEAINKKYRDGEITAIERSRERELKIVENVLRDYTKGMIEKDGRNV